jgi:quinol-cytochrome oxidoreductase complex cytochrome b subunit
MATPGGMDAVAASDRSMASVTRRRVASQLGSWLYERTGLDALTYPVPAHANGILYTLGGITLVGFIVLIVTGIYLAQFYHPHPAEARNSIVYVMTSAPFGDVVRGVHYWAAMGVTITVSLHLLRVFVSGAYKAPREVNWLVGLGLLAVTVGFVFTGTVIKWDQEGVEALVHNQDAASLMGAIGGWFSTDFSAAVPTLVRVYFAHVAILPALLTLLTAYHIFLIKVHGMTPLPKVDGRETDPTIDHSDKAALYGEPIHPFTTHIRKIGGWGLILVAVLTTVALVFAPPLGPAGVAGIEITKPPFMFWWLYAGEDVLGIRGLLLIPAAFWLLLAVVPFIDRGRNRSLRQRRAILIAAALITALLIGLTIFTALTPPVAHTAM